MLNLTMQLSINEVHIPLALIDSADDSVTNKTTTTTTDVHDATKSVAEAVIHRPHITLSVKLRCDSIG